ncbi:MAG: hypothetical protein DCF25_21365 [Leptolyngbya foveolarum]|uniref:Uncharacterized protein n=1 Tax=Leptolyngbya foveolarum TaxID=47253 RepID=A0A2W4TXQ1_9CYAN|nr:MAG: hypothetical protein DCF25_21365 [Leptolyngbya foveolarum]
MNDIRISIEGAAAVEAARALFEIEGINGEYEADAEVTRDGGLTVIATVVGLVGGTMAIAEQIRKWYLAYKKRQDVKRIEKVLIVTPNGRFFLENATTEEIAKALEPLAK